MGFVNGGEKVLTLSDCTICDVDFSICEAAPLEKRNIPLVRLPAGSMDTNSLVEVGVSAERLIVISPG